MKTIRRVTAYCLFREFSSNKKNLWGGHLWNLSYHVGIVGESTAETNKRYIENQKKMTTITLLSKLFLDEPTQAILFDAKRSATKVLNELIWNLRNQYGKTAKAPISRKNLNKIMKELPPRRKDYYSLSAQGTRGEVIGAYKSYFKL